MAKARSRAMPRVGVTGCVAAFVALLGFAGCKASYPEGKLACGADNDCPEGWECLGPASERRCYSSPEAFAGDSGDSGAPDDGGPGGSVGMDGGADSGDSMDGGGAGTDDGGMDGGDAGCAHGFEDDDGDGTCNDIDECATDNGGCGDTEHWTCINNTGGSPTCEDIDECATDNGGCGDPEHWRCKNKEGVAPTCEDIDECATDNGGCEQTCIDEDGSYACKCDVGTLRDDDHTCFGWTLPARVDDGTGNAAWPRIAMDASGNAVAVWSQNDTMRDNVWASRYVAGTGWDAPTKVENNDMSSALEPAVALDGSGNALAVWRQASGETSIWASRRAVGGAWSTPVLLETDDAGPALVPRIAADMGGNAIAVWQQHDGTHYNIRANRYVGGIVGTGWGTSLLLETDDAGHAEAPKVAMEPGGKAVAVWSQNDGTYQNIYANVYSGGWGVATKLEAATGYAVEAQVAMDGAGNATAVWHQSDGMRYNIWTNRWSANVWAGASLIELDDTTGATFPGIGVNSTGQVFAVWQQFDATPVVQIRANRYIPGTGWGMAIPIEPNNTGPAQTPQVGVDGAGNAIAVWTPDDSGTNDVWTNRYVAGTGWQSSHALETDAGDAADAQVAVDANGNALVVWQQHDGMRWEIRYARYEAE